MFFGLFKKKEQQPEISLQELKQQLQEKYEPSCCHDPECFVEHENAPTQKELGIPQVKAEKIIVSKKKPAKKVIKKSKPAPKKKAVKKTSSKKRK